MRRLENREKSERERQTDRKTDRDAHSIHIFEFRLSNGEDCERKSEHHKYSTNVHFSLSLSLLFSYKKYAKNSRFCRNVYERQEIFRNLWSCCLQFGWLSLRIFALQIFLVSYYFWRFLIRLNLCYEFVLI